MKVLSNIDLGGVANILNIPAPQGDGDLVTKKYVSELINSTISGFDFQADVDLIQANEIDLSTVLEDGKRIIITDVNKAYLSKADTTLLTTVFKDSTKVESVPVEDGDVIVSLGGNEFALALDVSIQGDGIFVYNRGDLNYYRFVGKKWNVAELSVNSAGSGLSKTEGVFAVKFDNTTIGLNVEGQLEYKGEVAGAGNGLTKVGAEFAVKGDNTTIEVTTAGVSVKDGSITKAKLGADVPLGTVLKVSQTIGDNVAKTFNIDHAFNTKDVIVQVYELATGATVQVESIRATESQVQLVFGAVPSTDEFRVVILA